MGIKQYNDFGYSYKTFIVFVDLCQKHFSLYIFIVNYIYFFLSGFFFTASTFHNPVGKGRPLKTPSHHFHPLHRQSDINITIAAGRSPLRIASDRTLTGKPCFPSASCIPLGYTPYSKSLIKTKFLIGTHSMQDWTATTRHGVTRKRNTKRLKHKGNLFRKNIQ